MPPIDLPSFHILLLILLPLLSLLLLLPILPLSFHLLFYPILPFSSFFVVSSSSLSLPSVLPFSPDGRFLPPGLIFINFHSHHSPFNLSTEHHPVNCTLKLHSSFPFACSRNFTLAPCHTVANFHVHSSQKLLSPFTIYIFFSSLKF